MKTLYLILILIVAFAPTNDVICQVGTGLENNLGLNEGNLRFGNGIKPISKEKKIDFKGSSLLLQEGSAGFITFKDGNRSNVLKLNYDLLTGTIIIDGSKENYGVPILYADSMLIGNDIFDKNPYTRYVAVETEEGLRMVEIIVDGEYSLYKYESAALRKPTYNAALDTGEKRYTIKREVAYLLHFGGQYVKLPKKLKKLAKDRKIPRRVKSLASSSKTNLKSELELVKLFQELNEAQ